MTPRAKLEAGESLTDADRVALVELLDDRDLLEKMVVGHVQSILSGGDGEDDDDEDPFSFPARPDDSWESEKDDFKFPSRPGETGR